VTAPARRTTYLPMEHVPHHRDGTVHHVVRPGTIVTQSAQTHRAFATPGDHICGVIDRAGVSLAVFDAASCPECHEGKR
jgi:hypothetical protein